MSKAIDMKNRKPLSEKEAEDLSSKEGVIVALVSVDIDFMLDVGFEGFLDDVSYKVLESGLLSDISYSAKRLLDSGTLEFEITGSIDV